MTTITNGLRPNHRVTHTSHVIYAVATLAAIAGAWQVSASALPSPGEVGSAFVRLWRTEGLFEALGSSFMLNVEAIAWSAGIALALAYLTVLPAARPIAAAISKLRFSGMVGWSFVFTLYARDGHQLKMWMLVFGMAPFLLTTMVAIVAAVPREQLDHARTLHANEWRVVHEVVIRGTADQAIEAIRQSAAMGWMMLTMVEGVVRSEGGIGVLLLDQHKHLKLDAAFALIGVVLVVGVLQDYAFAWLRRTLCPYAALTTERS